MNVDCFQQLTPKISIYLCTLWVNLWGSVNKSSLYRLDNFFLWVSLWVIWSLKVNKSWFRENMVLDFFSRSPLLWVLVLGGNKRVSKIRTMWDAQSSWACGGILRFLVCEGSGCYFPMQKLLNIRPSRSSGVNCPVISLRWSCAKRRSSASNSPAPWLCSW